MIWAPVSVSVMEISFGWVAQPAGSKTKPRRFSPAGFGVLCCFCLPDPRRRVLDDAYYDYAYDDRFNCKCRELAGGTVCVHAGFGGEIQKKRNYRSLRAENQGLEVLWNSIENLRVSGRQSGANCWILRRY